MPLMIEVFGISILRLLRKIEHRSAAERAEINITKHHLDSALSRCGATSDKAELDGYGTLVWDTRMQARNEAQGSYWNHQQQTGNNSSSKLQHAPAFVLRIVLRFVAERCELNIQVKVTRLVLLCVIQRLEFDPRLIRTGPRSVLACPPLPPALARSPAREEEHNHCHTSDGVLILAQRSQNGVAALICWSGAGGQT